MTDMKTDGMVLGTDEPGRVRTPLARRVSLLDEFERNGLNGQKFAALAGIKYQTFAACSLKRRRLRGGTTPATPVAPAHLATERVALEPEEVRQQPAGWRKLGEEVTEELDWKPAQFIKRHYIRPKYAQGERIVIAPLPARLIEKGPWT